MKKGFTTLEMVLSIAIVVACLYLFTHYTGVRHKVLVGSTATAIEQSLRQCRTLAASSRHTRDGRGVARLVFRPRGGPYQSYTVSVDEQEDAEHTLGPGVFLVDTTGTARDDVLFVREDGRLCAGDEGVPLQGARPAVLTVASDQTDTVAQLFVDLASGDVQVR